MVAKNPTELTTAEPAPHDIHKGERVTLNCSLPPARFTTKIAGYDIEFTTSGGNDVNLQLIEGLGSIIRGLEDRIADLEAVNLEALNGDG